MKNALKNILKVAFSNVGVLVIGIAVSIFLPKIISTIDYANYKIFTLYTSYIGVLLFGFNDGVYLKYSGLDYDSLDKKKFRTFNLYVLILTLIMSVVIIATSFFFKNEYFYILLFLGLYLIPFNIVSYYQQISQVTKRFGEYSIRKIINSLLSLLIIVLLFLFAKTGLDSIVNYKTYILFFIGTNLIMAIWYMITYRNIVFGKRIRLKEEGKELGALHKIGIPLLIANLITILFLNIDRQFVSIFFDKLTYGRYAFSYNIMTLISTVISAVSIVMYPMLKNADEEEVKKLYPVLSGTIIAFAFFCLISLEPISLFIPWFLPEYTDSVQVLRIIFPSIVFNCAVNVIVYNYFKIYNKTKSFLFLSCGMLLLSVGCNVIGVIYQSITFITITTVASMLLWFIISDLIISRIHKKFNLRLYIFIAINLAGYYLALLLTKWWLSLIAYVACFGLSFGLIMFKQLKEFFFKAISSKSEKAEQTNVEQVTEQNKQIEEEK